MYRYLDKRGADVARLAETAPRLISGDEPVWELDDLSDIELTAYKTALEATIASASDYIDERQAHDEYHAVIDETGKRQMEVN